MADLTPLDEKLGEVLGLAQAAQAATKTVREMEDAEGFADDLDRMHDQAAETERRTDDPSTGARAARPRSARRRGTPGTRPPR